VVAGGTVERVFPTSKSPHFDRNFSRLTSDSLLYAGSATINADGTPKEAPASIVFPGIT
jgi:hypothetical protein